MHGIDIIIAGGIDAYCAASLAIYNVERKRRKQREKRKQQAIEEIEQNARAVSMAFDIEMQSLGAMLDPSRGHSP